ncbi:MAG: hypothetical protein M3253_02915, partial [Chloroflexota bacterium]|nr:hypothetical protein [Chloroflexota bacterium]
MTATVALDPDELEDLADLRAGRVRPADEVFAELDQDRRFAGYPTASSGATKRMRTSASTVG